MRISASYFLGISLVFLSHGLAAQDTPTNERELEEQASQLQINPVDSIGPMTNELERGTISSDVLRGLVDENNQERLRIEPSNEPGNERRLNIAAIRQHAGHNAIVFKHTAAGNQSSITPGADFVAMSPGDIVAIESVGEEFKVERDGGLVATTSATKLLVLERDGSYRNLRLFHVSEGLGWNREFSEFIGELMVGVIDTDDVTYAGALPPGASIPVQLDTASGELSTSTLDIGYVGQPYKTVIVRVDAPDDPFVVRLISQVDTRAPPARLDVNRLRLTITAPNELMGFGIGSGRIVVSGKNTRLPEGESIVLKASDGGLEDIAFEVGPNGVAEGTLRSSWIGPATLSLAPNSIYEADPVMVTYRFPYRFIIFSVIGAFFGAVVSVYRRYRSGNRRRLVLLADGLIGLLIGCMVPLLVYAGFNLPRWFPVPRALTGEIVPLLLAFLGAVATASLIDWFLGKREIAPAPGG